MTTSGDRRRHALADAAPRASRQGGYLDSQLDSGLLDQWLPAPLHTSRWLGWRLRLLVAMALLGCLGLFAQTLWLADQPHIDATWRAGAQGELELVGSDNRALAGLAGRTLTSASGGGHVATVDALALLRSPRWLPDEAERLRHEAMHRELRAVWMAPQVTLNFGDDAVEVERERHGAWRLGLTYWLLSVFALVLMLMSMLIVLVRPSLPNALYAVMGLSQCGNLLFIAVSTVSDLGLPAGYPAWEPHVRAAFDLATAAAVLHAACLHPHRLPGGRYMALTGWALAVGVVASDAVGALPHPWWWTQLGGTALGLAAIGLLGWSYRLEPNPYAIVIRRFGIVTVGTWVLLTVAIAAARHQPNILQTIGAAGSMTWVFFIASLLLLVPFISKSQQMLREFSLLAGVSTIATSLDLLFITAFSFGHFTSVTLAVFLSLGLYAAVRQRMINHLRGTGIVTMERLFEQLYRMAREVEAHPERAGPSLLRLLGELFEPLESTISPQATHCARSSSDGSTLTVPVPNLRRSSTRSDETVVLRFSRRGRKLFTEEDARLASRIVEQLKRAVVFDQAVERGRSEERSRLAQDLHDDIGARLLTLMYQAQSPEQEDYIRHTLQDLKTLTRGLAATSHRLSHASAEWKADLQQRLQLANVGLDWQTHFDRDAELSVTQWSALTRVLRELVSNTIAHAKASQVSIRLTLTDDRLELNVADDGCGSNPKAWSHGLGLGGIRKRIKQLGGEVAWVELVPHGIECRVSFGAWSQSFGV